jgi:hypothetical protein
MLRQVMTGSFAPPRRLRDPAPEGLRRQELRLGPLKLNCSKLKGHRSPAGPIISDEVITDCASHKPLRVLAKSNSFTPNKESRKLVKDASPHRLNVNIQFGRDRPHLSLGRGLRSGAHARRGIHTQIGGYIAPCHGDNTRLRHKSCLCLRTSGRAHRCADGTTDTGICFVREISCIVADI